MGGWGWKAKDGAVGGLRYEPGNWGDLLKHTWLLHTLDALSATGLGRILDPFAGAPVYPLGATVRARLERLSDARLQAAFEPYLSRGLWPGSASLLADAVAGRMPEGGGASVGVFDQDDGRCRALAESGRFSVLPLASGYDVLAGGADRCVAEGAGFLLLDPYDFLPEWEGVLPGILSAAARTAILLYVYNRSGRGESHFRAYRSFRRALEAGGRRFCTGRVPSDGFLPTAYHEMVLLPSDAMLGGGGYAALCELLSRRTHRLSGVIADLGVFESA